MLYLKKHKCKQCGEEKRIGIKVNNQHFCNKECLKKYLLDNPKLSLREFREIVVSLILD